MTNPTVGGLEEWVQSNSPSLNTVNLTSRHASFIAAILVHEKRITSSVRGNAGYLHFPLFHENGLVNLTKSLTPGAADR